MIRFGPEICSNLEAASRREWLETNGLGGFASSTVACLSTRRYHGLLTAALHPPVRRAVLLSKFEEALVIDGRRFELSANQYPGVVHPQGYQYLVSFRLDPFPVFTYQVEGVLVEKSIFMVQGENTTVIQYELKSAGGGPVDEAPHPAGRYALELRPLIAFRDYHSTTHENGALNPHVQAENSLLTVSRHTWACRRYTLRTTPTGSMRPATGIATSSTSESESAA